MNYLEIYPLIFAIFGFIGILLRVKLILPWVICPSPKIWVWFFVVFVHCSIDFAHEFYIFDHAFDRLINRLDEAAEFLVACSGFLYLRLNRHSLLWLMK
ncbi:hypothetical protein BVY03_00625 [bacterium K02(2017)]|nr:hypothetical protein BVY03_00625 [bacterium K02(2017)]